MRVNVLEIDTAREGYATRPKAPGRAELGLSESIWILLSLSYANLPGRTLPARVDALIFACPVRKHVAGWVTVHRWPKNLRGMTWRSTRGIFAP